MLVLSIEMSSLENDVALVRDGTVAARRTWAALKFHHTRLFDLLREVLAEAGVTPEQIELFAVGRGPGRMVVPLAGGAAYTNWSALAAEAVSHRQTDLRRPL